MPPTDVEWTVHVAAVACFEPTAGAWVQRCERCGAELRRFEPDRPAALPFGDGVAPLGAVWWWQPAALVAVDAGEGVSVALGEHYTEGGRLSACSPAP